MACLVQYLLSDSGLCWILQRKLKHLHHTQKSRLLEYILPSSSIPPHIFPCAAVLYLDMKADCLFSSLGHAMHYFLFQPPSHLLKTNMSLINNLDKVIFALFPPFSL